MSIEITNVVIFPSNDLRNGNLLAYAEVTLGDVFVIHEVKVIRTSKGRHLVMMPTRKTADHCERCGQKNPLLQRYCGQCGTKLSLDRRAGRLHYDCCHPICPDFRRVLEASVLAAFYAEKSKEENVNLAFRVQNRKAVPA